MSVRSGRVARRSKTDEVDIEGFFAGVAEVRAYLDRSIQDPKRRIARLSKIAADLLKPRSKAELSRWIVAELAAAVGAEHVALLGPLSSGGFRLLAHTGSKDEAALATAMEAASALELHAPRLQGTELFVPVPGVLGLVGVLWLRLTVSLDPASQALVQAILDTAGVALEQPETVTP